VAVVAAIVITTIFGDASIVSGNGRAGNAGLFQVVPGQVVSDVASGLNGSSCTKCSCRQSPSQVCDAVHQHVVIKKSGVSVDSKWVGLDLFI